MIVFSFTVMQKIENIICIQASSNTTAVIQARSVTNANEKQQPIAAIAAPFFRL